VVIVVIFVVLLIVVTVGVVLRRRSLRDKAAANRASGLSRELSIVMQRTTASYGNPIYKAAGPVATVTDADFAELGTLEGAEGSVDHAVSSAGNGTTAESSL
jgi:hypothetical protein